ncbi:MAG: SPFH domain-containing protein, partial [Polyangiaceae bacterium]
MAAIDIVRWDGTADELIWKFPSSQLSTATQLIVGETQVATLFKDGQRYDVFGAGRHTLKTANIPLLGSLVNLPFGGASPFSAEIWFANKAIPLNLKWGTSNPIQLEDPQYGVVLPVSAFGQLGIEIIDTSLFISTLIGRLPSFRASHVLDYFKGVMMSELRASITNAIAKRQVGLLQIEAELVSISDSVGRDIQPHFQRFGLDLHLFRIMSITFPQDDPSAVELRRAKANAMRRKVEGTSYQQERSFDVMQNAASNQGIGGTFASAGAGLAIGHAV